MQLLNTNVPTSIIPAARLQAIVLDWAGTTVDFGSLAPIRTLAAVFEKAGLPITEAEARRDMGLPKRDHIRNILAGERVAAAWTKLHGEPSAEDDLEDLYGQFIPFQLSCLNQYSSLIEGIPEAVERFRGRGLKIGTTTGYTREMLGLLLANCERSGYSADCNLTPEDVGAGRPFPFMIYSLAVRLQVYPLSAIVKVGDTAADIAEGLHAGTWSVGIAKTGNMVGLSPEDFAALSQEDRQRRLTKAHQALTEAGAHYVIDSVAELDPVLDDIDARLQSSAS